MIRREAVRRRTQEHTVSLQSDTVNSEFRLVRKAPDYYKTQNVVQQPIRNDGKVPKKFSSKQLFRHSPNNHNLSSGKIFEWNVLELSKIIHDANFARPGNKIQMTNRAKDKKKKKILKKD